MVDIQTDILSPYLAITAMLWNIHFDCTQIQQLIYSRIQNKPQYQTVSYIHADSRTLQCCNVSNVHVR
jgi:hypothetical protein